MSFFRMFWSPYLRRVPQQLSVPPPRVEVGGVRLDVLVRFSDAVRMEHELVRGEEDAAVAALDALGARGVVARRHELWGFKST